jgi:hypothetical protein
VPNPAVGLRRRRVTTAVVRAPRGDATAQGRRRSVAGHATAADGGRGESCLLPPLCPRLFGEDALRADTLPPTSIETTALGRFVAFSRPFRRFVGKPEHAWRGHVRAASERPCMGPQRYDAHAARSSLETSLRELGTDTLTCFCFTSRSSETIGVLANSLGRLVSHVTTDSDRRKRWNELVGNDCGDVETCASLLLRYALRENASGVVLFSTIKRERIRAAAAEAMSSGADDSDLDAFVSLVEAELPPTAS